MRGTKTVGNRLHISNGGRRCAQAKTAVTRRQHRRIVVFPHHAPGDEDRVQRHEDGLYHQNRQHRQRQRRQFPQLQAHQRHCQEQ